MGRKVFTIQEVDDFLKEKISRLERAERRRTERAIKKAGGFRALRDKMCRDMKIQIVDSIGERNA